MADRTPDPRSAPSIRWGILGAGGIAGEFADAVNQHTRAQLVAVGSRNRDRATRFATAHGIPTTHSRSRSSLRRWPRFRMTSATFSWQSTSPAFRTRKPQEHYAFVKEP